MRRFIIFTLTLCIGSGCAVFEPPPSRATGPTVPTGDYDSTAEKWADESTAARRKAEKEKTEKELQRLDRR